MITQYKKISNIFSTDPLVRIRKMKWILDNIFIYIIFIICKRFQVIVYNVSNLFLFYSVDR